MSIRRSYPFFRFTLFGIQIEDEKSCSYDYVDIYGGLDDYSGPLYGRYCGLNVSRFLCGRTKIIIAPMCNKVFYMFFHSHPIWRFFFSHLNAKLRDAETSGCHFNE